MKYAFSVLVLLAVVSLGFGQTIAEQIQQGQVTIRAGDYSGSGTLIHTKDGTSWILTCGHLFSSIRSEREVYENGAKKTLVEFATPKVYKILSDGKQDVGRIELLADVIRYSDAVYGQDLAVLRIRQKDTLKQTTKFYLDDAPPAVDTELYHCGSLQGEAGANSLTTGVISKIGRLYTDGKGAERVYDQTSCTAFPGSSGGPVCLKKDGRYVGCLVRGYGEGFNLIVPVRRIREWTKEVGMDFLIDETKEVPTLDEIKKKPIELHAPASSWRMGNIERRYQFLIYTEPQK